MHKRLIAGVLLFAIALGSSPAPIRASAQTLPDPAPVTDCLKPYRKGQHPAAGDYGVVVNSCNFAVTFMLCNHDAKPGTWNATQACVGKDGKVGGYLGVAANGRTGVFVGEKVFWFACRAPLSLRDMKFDPVQGLSGRCAMFDHDPLSSPKPPVQPASPTTAAPSGALGGMFAGTPFGNMVGGGLAISPRPAGTTPPAPSQSPAAQPRQATAAPRLPKLSASQGNIEPQGQVVQGWEGVEQRCGRELDAYIGSDEPWRRTKLSGRDAIIKSQIVVYWQYGGDKTANRIDPISPEYINSDFAQWERQFAGPYPRYAEFLRCEHRVLMLQHGYAR